MKTSFGNFLSNAHIYKDGCFRPLAEAFRERGRFFSARSLFFVCLFVPAFLWQPQSVAVCVLPNKF